MRATSSAGAVALEALVVAALVSGIVPLLLPALRRIAMDRPNERSSHTVPVPRGGGLALVAAMTVAASFWPWPELTLIFAVVALSLVGFMDDLLGLPSVPRLVVVTVISAVVVVPLLTSPQGTRSFPVPLVALIVLGVALLVGYTNAYNFMDGINGISGLNAMVTGGSLATVSLSYSAGVTSMAVALAAAGAAFLPWNLPKAQVFLGDAGSYALGFGLAACGLVAWTAGVPTSVVIAPFGIYVLDTGAAVLHRLVGRRPVLQAHREHVYQRLVDAGARHGTVACVVALFSLLLVGSAAIGRHYATVGLVSAALVLTLYLALPKLAMRSMGSSA